MGSDLDRLVPLQTGAGRQPLYCVHAVSGSAYSYHGLARLLGQDQPVYGFEAPGFDNDRAPVRSVPALAGEYTEILRDFQPAGPYRLLGWSMGGVLAFEMARRLAALGDPPSILILVDAGRYPVTPLPPERDIVRRYVHDMMGRSGESVPAVGALLDGWPEDLDAAAALAAIGAAGVLPAEFDADLLVEQYTVFRAHLEAFYGFAVTGTYGGPTVHIVATDSHLEESRWEPVAPDLTRYELPGSHYSIWTGERLHALAGIVRRSLDRWP